MSISGKETSQRLTWDEIVSAYPDQWVGLEEIEYKSPEDHTNIMTAIVKYSDKSKNELTHIQIQTKGMVTAIYTTPDSIFELGTVGYFG